MGGKLWKILIMAALFLPVVANAGDYRADNQCILDAPRPFLGNGSFRPDKEAGTASESADMGPDIHLSVESGGCEHRSIKIAFDLAHAADESRAGFEYALAIKLLNQTKEKFPVTAETIAPAINALERYVQVVAEPLAGQKIIIRALPAEQFSEQIWVEYAPEGASGRLSVTLSSGPY